MGHFTIWRKYKCYYNLSKAIGTGPACLVGIARLTDYTGFYKLRTKFAIQNTQGLGLDKGWFSQDIIYSDNI